jgi:hypothetical protein
VVGTSARSRASDTVQPGFVVSLGGGLPATLLLLMPTSNADEHRVSDAPSTWADLALHAPGERARAEADRARKAAPVRSVLGRLMGVHTEERAWRLGAEGEVRVATQLDKLSRRDTRWRYLHAIPVGDHGADIDHLVIGPGGVFTLNAKHHPNARIWVGGDVLMVNGVRHPYVRNSRHEAARASRLLSAACGFPVAVSGIVVPVNAADITIKKSPSDVWILGRRRLRRWLRQQPQILGESACSAIFEQARRSTTWARPQSG